MTDDCKPCEPTPAPRRLDEDAGGGGTMGAGGGGSNDVTSGGGNGAGIPDAETAMRMGEVVTRGDAKHDREKLFPESVRRSQPGSDAGGIGGTAGRPDRAPKQAAAGAPDPMGDES